MGKKEGIPKEVLDELDIKKDEKEDIIKVKAIVENHQIKLPIPAAIRLELDMKKGQELKVKYDEKKKQIIYQI